MTQTVMINGVETAVPEYAQNTGVENNLGRAGGLPTISMYKDHFLITNGDRQDPVGTPLPIIILEATPAGDAFNRAYYASVYTPGTVEAPTCSSKDGIAPDAGDSIQCATCAMCPHAQWGSKGKGQACAQGKTLYVVPANEPRSDVYQIRIAPTSLKAVGAYGGRLNALGVHSAAVITHLGHAPAAPGIDYPILSLDLGGFLEPDQLQVTMQRSTALKAQGLIVTPRIAAPVAQPLIPAPAPVTSVTPAGFAPAPAPVSPAPVSPAPVTPAGFAPAPAPVTPAPVSPAPVSPAPVTPAPAPVSPELDSAGQPWSVEMHSSGRTFIKDGTWKKKKGWKAEAPSDNPALDAGPAEPTEALTAAIATWGAPK